MSSDKVEQEETPTVEEELEEAKRFFALKKWNEAADAYAQVLESLREKYEEEDPIFAPLYHRYGQALLEHAIATSGALGGGGGSKDGFELEPKAASSTVASARAKEPVAGSSSAMHTAEAGSSKSNGKADPRFTFGGDAEESDEEESGAAASKGENGEDDDEDDLGLAFSILELARIGYEKALHDEKAEIFKTLEGEEWSAVMVKSQLAEVLNHLADVGLESENFEQASADYKSSLELLTPLLQPHSRRLANAYLRLGLALEYHPDASLQATAEKYVKGSCTTLEKRLDALKGRQRVLDQEEEAGEDGLAKAEAAASELRTEKAEIESVERLRDEGVLSGKSEGAEEEAYFFEKDEIAAMDSEQLTKEEKEVTELIQDLKLKLEEYSNTAIAPGGSNIAATSSQMISAKEKVQQAINEALLGSSTNALGAPPPLNPNAPVNNISSMVKKKKKPEESKANGKRKETTVSDATPSEVNKKVKVD